MDWLLFTYQFVGIVAHMFLAVWSFIYKANETYK
jgi:hypothetical protein